MAPHALVEKPSSSSASVHLDAPSNSLLKANPFGTLVDPSALKGSAYTSLNTVLSQTVYAISSKIFSYETPGSPDLLDSHIQLWSQTYQRPNSFGVVPFFHKLQVRSGASNAILGYYSKNGTAGQPISVLSGLNGLVYMQPNLASRSNYTSLPLSLNVSAIDFDPVSNSLVSNYISSLSVARSLGYSVVTPVSARDGLELQHLTILNHYLASLTGSPSINLFDGPEFAATFTKLNVLSVAQVGELYQGLLAGSAGVEYTDLNQAVDLSLQKLNELTGKSYSQFEYVGSDAPETVFVSYGAHESSQVSEIVAKSKNIGLIKVRVPLPFNQARFIEAIPSTTKKLVVLSQVSHNESVTSSLKADVTAALFLGGAYHRLSIDEFKYPLNFAWTPITVAKVLAEFVPTLDVDSLLAQENVPLPITLTANTSPEGNFLFWGRDNFWNYTVQRIALSLSLDDSKTVTIRNKYDNSRGGGLFQSQISSTSKSNASSIDSADVVLIDNLSILDSYDILATAKPGATIVYIHNKPFGSVEEDIVPKLPIEFRRTLAINHNKLLLVDFSILEKLESVSSSASGFAGEFLTQLAFWRASLPELKGFIVNKLLQANGNDYELLAAVLDKFIQTVDEQKGLRDITVAPEWADLEEEKKEEVKKEDEKKENTEDEDEKEPLPFFPTETSFFANSCVSTEDSEETIHSGYKSLATKLTFPEAYGLKQDLRPELPVKNFIVKVQENKRLTPQEYSRNIFHIEFDTTGTDLKYDIGEALGIHGRNNAEEVEKFLQYFGIDGDSLVETTNRDDPSVLEVRSARQILTDGVDFLGKPPKRFYEALAEYATDEKEKATLEKLASAEGAADLKKRQEVDFDTYFDVLDEFKSARPAFSDLVRIIAPLKRREYSIASSQKLHPNSVHLLIVVVDWIDPRGRTRYGHTSKYLSDLKIGDELVVSVKPSVMKLPPLSTQPIVMSGLGTGLAPFKAFVEEKIWQQQQGMEIGEIYLYMGSRHKKEEYLYGELWEAYKDAGILTHIGAAFSRDQPEKIYIQDKIRESIEDLTDAIVAKNGSFYLCGPTWPVPDITACLEDIVQNGAKKEGKVIKEIAKVVEEMKENGRYILEVY